MTSSTLSWPPPGRYPCPRCFPTRGRERVGELRRDRPRHGASDLRRDAAPVLRPARSLARLGWPKLEVPLALASPALGERYDRGLARHPLPALAPFRLRSSASRRTTDAFCTVMGGGGARNPLAFLVPFGLRSPASFSRRAMNARSSAVVGVGLRRGGLAVAGSGRRMSILAKRRCPLMSLRRPTMRYENAMPDLPPMSSRTSKLAPLRRT